MARLTVERGTTIELEVRNVVVSKRTGSSVRFQLRVRIHASAVVAVPFGAFELPPEFDNSNRGCYGSAHIVIKAVG
jgi:hypothetical protein